MSLSQDGTRPGCLPAWEVAKAAAYDVVLDHLSDDLGMSVPIGPHFMSRTHKNSRKDDFGDHMGAQLKK